MDHTTTDTAALLAEIDAAMEAYGASIERGLALAAEMRQPCRRRGRRHGWRQRRAERVVVSTTSARHAPQQGATPSASVLTASRTTQPSSRRSCAPLRHPMTNWKAKITRTSSRGLQVVYDSSLSPTAQISIKWNNGLGGGVGMSIEQAKELQTLLDVVLTRAREMPGQLEFKAEGLQWPAELGGFALMGPLNRRGKWRWYRRNIIVDGRLVAERIKVGSDLRPIWESLTHE
jgi:hypothetical protein